MKSNNYFFGFDTPNLLNKNIRCSFYISNIESKRCFFFIIEENGKLVLYYLFIKPIEFIKLAKKYHTEGSCITLEEIANKQEFQEEYCSTYLRTMEFASQDYVRKTIDKMVVDNIGSAKNDISGLDGFSVELKLNQNDDIFYSWCIANDRRYFYVLDFVNYILDTVGVNKDYRFIKR